MTRRNHHIAQLSPLGTDPVLAAMHKPAMRSADTLLAELVRGDGERGWLVRTGVGTLAHLTPMGALRSVNVNTAEAMLAKMRRVAIDYYGAPIATVLKTWRAAMEVSQPRAADMLGVKLGTLRDWEQGNTAPPAEGPLRIALRALAEGRVEPLGSRGEEDKGRQPSPAAPQIATPEACHRHPEPAASPEEAVSKPDAFAEREPEEDGTIPGERLS